MAKPSVHILVRSHHYDAATALLVARLRADVAGRGIAISMVCDETRGPVDTGDVDKISLTAPDLTAWGWMHIPPDWGWFCGDACYYAAIAHGITAQRLLLIENDVFFHRGALAALVDVIEADTADIGAAQLRSHSPVRKYSAGLTKIGRDANVGCIFPVTFLRADLVERMHDIRRAIQRDATLRVNDEGVLASMMQEPDVRALDLATAQPHLFPEAFFQTDPPNLLEHFLASDPPKEAAPGDPSGGHFVHPTVTVAGVFERILKQEKRAGRRRLRQILRQATPAQRAQFDAAIDRMEALPS